jgi:hypothetical protein
MCWGDGIPSHILNNKIYYDSIVIILKRVISNFNYLQKNLALWNHFSYYGLMIIKY